MLLPDAELLRVLIAFAESKNLIAAAESLRISQPAVTQRLQRLQDQVPLPLYTFSGKKKVLTPYGKSLYELAKDNLMQLSFGFENLNRRYAEGSHLVLRLGCRKEFFKIFAETITFPGQIEFNDLTEDEALQQLRAEKIDIILSSELIDTQELMSKKIFENSSRFMTHKKWAANINSFRELQKNKDFFIKTPCIRHKTEKYYFNMLLQNFKIKENDLNCKAVVDDWPSLQSLVENGIGYSIVPNFGLAESKNLISFDVPHAIIPVTNFYAIFHRKLKSIEAFQKALSFSIKSS